MIDPIIEHRNAAMAALPRTKDDVAIYPGLKLWNRHGERVTAKAVAAKWALVKARGVDYLTRYAPNELTFAKEKKT